MAEKEPKNNNLKPHRGNDRGGEDQGGENKMFSFFSPSKSKEGKGVTKKQAEFNGKYNLPNFFLFLKNRFGEITKANLLYLFLNFSLFFMLFALTGYANKEITTPSSPFYQQTYGMIPYGGVSPGVLSRTAVWGVTAVISVATGLTRAFMYTGYTLFITFGLSNVGMAYLVRGMVRREHLFPWHDFWLSIKRNYKQGIVVGALDLAVCYLLYYALLFYGSNRVDFTMLTFFYLTIAFAAIYLIMRMYFYLLIVTFDLKLLMLLKNALIFSLLGIKRNIIALAGIALTVYINLNIYIFLPSVGIIAPLIFTVGLVCFISAYAVFPVIDKYMIRPYYKPEKAAAEKPVFTDRG